MNLISMGYLYRQVAKRPEWLRAEHVEDIFNLLFTKWSPPATRESCHRD